jgi:hypothetical protein
VSSRARRLLGRGGEHMGLVPVCIAAPRGCLEAIVSEVCPIATSSSRRESLRTTQAGFCAPAGTASQCR